MTIPEACQLVLEAGAMGNGGEIYIFDMGKPVRIIDLARKMIKLAGFIPDKEIKIKIVGLRPGEKLYEELLNDNEIQDEQIYPKIFVGKASFMQSNELNLIIEELQFMDKDKMAKTLLEIANTKSFEKIVGAV